MVTTLINLGYIRQPVYEDIQGVHEAPKDVTRISQSCRAQSVFMPYADSVAPDQFVHPRCVICKLRVLYCVK